MALLQQPVRPISDLNAFVLVLWPLGRERASGDDSLKHADVMVVMSMVRCQIWSAYNGVPPFLKVNDFVLSPEIFDKPKSVILKTPPKFKMFSGLINKSGFHKQVV